MENLEMIVKGVSEETALTVKNSLSEFIVKANEWREQIDSLVIESVNDTAKMKIAREARLFLKNNRLEAKRLTDMKRDEVKAKKLQFDLEDKAWLKGFQLVEEVCKSLEDKAKEKEEYAERVEAERKEKLRQDRWQQLGEYVEDEPYGLGEMPESTFNAFLTGARQQHEEKLEAQRKAEEERIEKIRIQDLHNERKHSLLAYWDFVPQGFKSLNMGMATEMEYRSVFEESKKLKKDYEEKQEKIRLQAERLKNEAETRNKRSAELMPFVQFIRDYNSLISLPEKEYQKQFSDIKRGAEEHWEYERQEQIKKQKAEEERLKLQREKEAELAKIQAELEMERKREELRIQREKQAEEAKKKAEREALLAPDKDKILNYVRTINPQTPDLSSTGSKEVFREINDKLEGWKKWAEKLVNEKL